MTAPTGDVLWGGRFTDNTRLGRIVIGPWGALVLISLVVAALERVAMHGYEDAEQRGIDPKNVVTTQGLLAVAGLP